MENQGVKIVGCLVAGLVASAGVNVSVKKDATGLWLKASKSGCTVIVR